MPQRGDILDLGPIGAVFHVRNSAEDTEGRALEMEWVLAPRSSGTPVHIHPTASESYEVLEGTLDLYVNGKWSTLSVGDKASVSPGIPHTFRNTADSSTRVYNTHSPAMRFGEYFGTIDRVVRSGVVPANRMTFKTMLYLSLIMTAFENEIISVKPPETALRLLAAVARSFGLRLPVAQ